MRSLLLPLALAALAAGALGCGASGGAADAGVPPEGLAEYDSAALLLRGPWLSPAGPGAVTIAWSTDLPARSRVEYGPDPSYGATAVGTVARPESEGIAEAVTAGWQHAVTVTGLAAATTYHYRVVSLAQAGADFTFRTPAAPASSFTFVLLGDVRTNHTDHQQVVDAVVAEAPELVLNTGDLTDAGGDELSWDTFFDIERDLVANTIFLPVYGNHEDVLGRTLFDTYFVPPPGALSPRTYSVDWKGVHVSVLDRYKSDLEDEVAWLDADLATPAARAARLRIVALHPPLYTFSNHAPDVAAREALWPVLTARGVGLVVTGHNHVYERFFVDGIHLVVTGGGGAPLYNVDDNVIPTQVGLRRAAASEHHYIRATAAAAGFRFEVKPTPVGALLDCFVIDPEQPGAELACP